MVLTSGRRESGRGAARLGLAKLMLYWGGGRGHHCCGGNCDGDGGDGGRW